MSLYIENNTHWKKSDIQTILRAAMNEAGVDPKEVHHVRVEHPRHGCVSYNFKQRDKGVIYIWLPKNGPKVDHHNPMVVLAAAGIKTATNRLAVQDSYFLANALAFEFAREVEETYESDDRDSLTQKRRDLSHMKRSTNPPNWGDGTRLVITRYANPLLDTSYIEFVEKKQAVIARAEVRIEALEKKIKPLQTRLKNARKCKKTAEKAIADAKKRRLS